MEVSGLIKKHGNVWNLQVNNDMIRVYEPLHAVRAPGFHEKVNVQKDFKYGVDDRHRLDIYFPAKEETNRLPVVVFFHGGGFVAGDNDVSTSLHGNVGYFFAMNGCVCVLATYRVLPQGHFPNGAEDIANALAWTKKHIAEYKGDANTILAVGQSAGGAHLAMAASLGKLAGIQLNGIVFMSAAFSYDLTQVRRRQNMSQYYQTDDESQIMQNTAVALFERCPRAYLEPLRMKIMVAELDPDEIKNANSLFQTAMKDRGFEPDVFIMEGHNHISNTYAIGLSEDKTGPEILAFLEKKNI